MPSTKRDEYKKELLNKTKIILEQLWIEERISETYKNYIGNPRSLPNPKAEKPADWLHSKFNMHFEILWKDFIYTFSRIILLKICFTIAKRNLGDKYWEKTEKHSIESHVKRRGIYVRDKWKV